MATWKKVIVSGSAVDIASLTLDTQLAVAEGGTGATAFADKAVIITQDSGTDTLAAVAMSTNGQLLIGGSSGPAVAVPTGGDGLTVTVGDGTLDYKLDAALTTVTSVKNASLVIGRDNDNLIKFGTDNNIIFEVGGGDNVIFKASGAISSSGDITGLNLIATGSGVSQGNVTATGTGSFAHVIGTKIVGALTGDVVGDVTGDLTGQADTVATIAGLAPNTATTQAAQGNITSLGTLTTLTVDNVRINGATIGHTDDTDLMTVADGVLTVAGVVSAGSVVTTGAISASTTLTGLNLIITGSGATQGNVTAKGTGSFTALEIDPSGDALTIDNLGTVSGSILSTGSFGHVEVAGNVFAGGLISRFGDANTGLEFASDTVKIEGNNVVVGEFASTFIALTGNITASGDISSSGAIRALTYEIGGHAIDDLNITAEFVDADDTIMSSKAIGARFAQKNADTTGTAAEATSVTAVATTDNAEFFVGMLDGASGTQAVETVAKFKYNPSSGRLSNTGAISASATTTALNLIATGSGTDKGNVTATGTGSFAHVIGTKIVGALTGDVVGDVTGDLTGQADTVATIAGLAPNTATTQAAQGNITSLGTLTTLTVDNVRINGATIGHTDDTDLMTVADGVLTVAGAVNTTGAVSSSTTITALNLIATGSGTDKGNVTGTGTGSFAKFVGDGRHLTNVAATSVDIDELTAFSGVPHATQDEFLISDNGTELRATMTMVANGAFALVSDDVTIAAGGAATVAQVQGTAITQAEAQQVANINSVTISNTQWGYLGALDQAVNTNSNVQFGNAQIDGNLIVAGTASFQHSENLLVADRFISIASGSATAGDGGIVVHSSAGDNPSGSAFGFEGGTANRWALQNDFTVTQSAMIPDAYVGVVTFSTAVPSGNPEYGGSDYGYGNIHVETDTGDIYVYS